MAIAVIGDIHGEFGVLAQIIQHTIPDGAEIIQVGDFGFWPELRRHYVVPSRPVRFVDGNHDHIELLLAAQCDWPNAIYKPRGSVEVIDGRRVLFLGGSMSVDRKWRQYKLGMNAWFDDEIVRQVDVETALENAKGGVDLMITHTPPDHMIRKWFSPKGLRNFGHDPATWVDLAARRVEDVWRALGEPPLYCGHMHMPITDGPLRILNINEVAVI